MKVTGTVKKMPKPNPHQEEIDFLMEREYVLQGELTRIHERLEHLLGAVAVHAADEPDNRPQLIIIKGGNQPDGAA